ncbi:MAG: DegT/DnrJ/EryC1/StrS family aminotransferase, partial [Bacteroidales bacterium]
AKMNEIQAAMGLLQLKSVEDNISSRKKISEFYRANLSKTEGISFFQDFQDVSHCYSYFPIFINEESYGKSRDLVFESLKSHNIIARKYFFPLISNFSMYRDNNSLSMSATPVAEKASNEVLCLPLYPDLEEEIVAYICELLNNKN